MTADRATVVEVQGWTGRWAPDDPDANFKADVAAYANLDPLATLRTLGERIDVPLGGLVHYVLAKWASAGSAGLLEIGPTMVERLWDVCSAADSAGTDEARLAAFDTLHAMLAWLRAPLHDE